MSDPFQRTVLAPQAFPSSVTSIEAVPDCSAAWALTVTACSMAAAGDTCGDPLGEPRTSTVATTMAITAAAAGTPIAGRSRHARGNRSGRARARYTVVGGGLR